LLKRGHACLKLRLNLSGTFFKAKTCYAKPLQDPRQHQPLSNERDHDHAESNEEDQVAVRKRLPVVEGKGDRERGGEGNDAAHADKPDRKRPLPRRCWIASRERGADPARNIGCRENPYESRGNNDQRDPAGHDYQFVE
jgi:hypothetical protein